MLEANTLMLVMQQKKENTKLCLNIILLSNVYGVFNKAIRELRNLEKKTKDKNKHCVDLTISIEHDYVSSNANRCLLKIHKIYTKHHESANTYLFCI